MAENQAIDIDDAQDGKAVRKPKAAGGKPPIMMIVSLAVAVAAIGFSAFMFLQLNGLRSKLEQSGTVQVPGEEETHHAITGEDGHTSADAVNFVIPAEKVQYELGEFMTNTSDNKFVKMSLIIELDSFYDKSEWEVYEAMMKKYDEGVTVYRNFQLGVEEDAKQKGGGHAGLPPQPDQSVTADSGRRGVEIVNASGGGGYVEVTPAMHGAPKAAPPPEMPEMPEKPRSLMVSRLMEYDSRIRDMINDEIGRTLAEDFIRPSGKNLFKDTIRLRINEIIGEQYGHVTEVLMPSVVSS
jgi:flagellar basal body-associated protein FliL